MPILKISLTEAFWLVVTMLVTTPSQSQSLRNVLERPLITGASVSADWSTLSPGKVLALRFTDSTNIRTLAFGGRPGKEVIKELDQAALKDRTAILGIDFLFWDSTLTDSTASLKALQTIMKYASSKNLFIVLGEIPELLPGRQGLRSKLNQEIAKSCKAYARCYLMPFDRLHKQVLKSGYLEIKGKRYSINELVPDGLHLSVPASEFLADLMQAILSGKTIERDGRIQLPSNSRE